MQYPHHVETFRFHGQGRRRAERTHRLGREPALGTDELRRIARSLRGRGRHRADEHRRGPTVRTLRFGASRPLAVGRRITVASAAWARVAYALLAREASLSVLGAFGIYVLASSFARTLMGASLPGGLNVGVVLGLLQLAGFFAFAARALRADRVANKPPFGRPVVGEPAETNR